MNDVFNNIQSLKLLDGPDENRPQTSSFPDTSRTVLSKGLMNKICIK